MKSNWLSFSSRSALCALVLALCNDGAIAASDPAGQLAELFSQVWEHRLAEDPLVATYQGDSRFNDRWPDLSAAARKERSSYNIEVLAKLSAIDRTRLSTDDQLNYELFRRELADRLSVFPFLPEVYALTPRTGIQTLSETASIMPFESVGDYQMWLKRLSGVPRYLDQNIELLRSGLREKRTQPRIIIERVLPQVSAQIVAAPKESPFFEPFRRYPDTVPLSERERLSAEAMRLIGAEIVPAYRRLDHFLQTEYLPLARATIGIWDTPDGIQFYANRVRHFTTTSMSAEQIHSVGLREVARLRQQMEQVMREVAFKGTLQEFFTYLRTNPQFYFHSSEELLNAYVLAAKRIEPELPRLFAHLYGTPFVVRPMPAESAPNTTSAGYDAPSKDGRRPGYLNVNLYRPEVRPKFEIEVLTLHESVPGHHLQQTLALEQESLPNFRRFAESAVYVEGWALYAETLGYELGLYRDPYSHFGQLSEDMWRALRLVIDTGIHSQRWSREQSIAYCRANAPLGNEEITNEVDRYIAWPGQALAYKIGEMKILELRARAEKRLGQRFDIRQFHDVVLATGAVPLDILEQRVNRWIEDTRASRNAVAKQ